MSNITIGSVGSGIFTLGNEESISIKNLSIKINDNLVAINVKVKLKIEDSVLYITTSDGREEE